MRALLQRVSQASVNIHDNINGSIEQGLVILLGIEEADTQEDINWLCKKVSQLRIFNDNEGKMNLSITDINGSYLVISQFTLHAQTKKGTRPSYTRAAHPNIAEPLYHTFIKTLQDYSLTPIQTGIFGADMKVQLINDGPVTIFLDSKQKAF